MAEAGHPLAREVRELLKDRAHSGQPQLLSPLRGISLGKAWAKNSINAAIYRGAGVLSNGGYQFGAFYRDKHTILLFRRTAGMEAVDVFPLSVSCNLNDAHNAISLGCDAEGFLHLCYNSHSAGLSYRRGTIPWRIDAWSDDEAMTGYRESKVTYPYFVSPRGEHKRLVFLYRHGSAENGQIHAKHYLHAEKRWIDIPGSLLTGLDFPHWSAGPYLHHPAIGPDGLMHLFFTWRTPLVGREGYVFNHNIDYACSTDWGLDWRASTGVPFTLPITPVSSETALGTAPGDNLMNQCSAATDSQGRPFATYYANDPQGVPQYHLLWRGEEGWRRRQIFSQDERFILTGRGTLRLPMSRPELLIAPDDRAWVIFTAVALGGRLAALVLDPPHYRMSRNNLRILWKEDLGAYEPVIDRQGFAATGLLSAYVQPVGQGDHESLEEIEDTEAFIADWRLV